jgi:hypothetical protein
MHAGPMVIVVRFDRTRPVLLVTRSDGDWCLLGLRDHRSGIHGVCLHA